MIDLTELQQLIWFEINQSGSFPRIAWANKDIAPARPYLSLTLEPIDIQDDTLAQDAPIWRGIMFCTVVIEADGFETAGQALVRTLAELFPSGTRLPMNDGTIAIIDGHPFQTRPYPDGADYRMPLQIKLKTDTP